MYLKKRLQFKKQAYLTFLKTWAFLDFSEKMVKNIFLANYLLPKTATEKNCIKNLSAILNAE